MTKKNLITVIIAGCICALMTFGIIFNLVKQNKAEDAFETNVAELEANIAELEAKLAELEATDTAAEGEIAALKAALATNAETITEILARLEALKEENASLKNCINDKHEIEYVNNNDGTHSYICTICGLDRVEDHSFSEDGVCVCGDQGYTYDEETNTYLVYYTPGVLRAFEGAQTSGTAEKPATVKLMNNIEVPGVLDGSNRTYAILITGGVMVFDLNGYTLSNTETRHIMQIGRNDQPADAVLTIEDNSEEQTGKISGTEVTVLVMNYGGTLTVNSGTFEVENSSAVYCISSTAGDVTVNGGKLSAVGPMGFVAIGISSNSGTLTVNNCEITARYGIKNSSGYAVINDCTINASSYAFTFEGSNPSPTGVVKGGTYNYKVVHLLTEGALGFDENGNGATFNNGLYASYSTLANMLAAGAGYYDADGKLIALSDGQKEITGKVTVGCAHTTSEHTDVTNNGDGTHTYTCTVCNKEVTENHTTDVTNNGDGTHTYTCTVCNNEVTEKHTYAGGECKCGEGSVYTAVLSAEEVKAAVANVLAAGKTDVTLVMESTPTKEKFAAIKSALTESTVEDGSINLTLKGVTVVTDYAFSDVTEISTVNLPDAIEIQDAAFNGCKSLVSVSAPKMQTVRSRAFGFTALTSVEFPELTSIANSVFNGVYNLSTIKLPKVTTFGQGALLIGAAYKFETMSLELTAEGEITFNGNSHFNVESQNYSEKVNLVLNIDKKSQVTKNADGTAEWKGYKFKSITFVGE